MKRSLPFVILLGVLAIVSGWLMSHVTFIGRVGINWFHKEYKFLKVWYKGAGVVLAVWLVLFGLHGLLQRKLSAAGAKVAHVIALLVALAGLYFTYNDYRHDLSHRLLGERFHLGTYLFWIGWMLISLFFLAQKSSAAALPDAQKS